MRTKRWFLLASLVLILQPTALPAESARRAQMFLWKATSPTTELYLLGSIHMGTQAMYPLPKAMEDAFNHSKYLVLEADLTKVDSVKLQELIFKKGMYGEVDGLSKHLPADLLKRALDLGSSLDMDPRNIERMKPWFLAVTLTALSIQKLGYSPELGIDRHFAEEATRDRKQILEVESMEFQLRLFSDFSEDLQSKFLASTLEEGASAKERMDLLLKAWLQGDVAAFEREVVTQPRQKHPDQTELYEKLIDDRNIEMAKKLASYLGTGDRYFVVVGAAHLVGDKGVVKLLEQGGFKLARVEAP